jgi:hypothetical protein
MGFSRTLELGGPVALISSDANHAMGCEVRLREEEDRIAYFVPRHSRLSSLTWGGACGEGGWTNDDGG